MSKENQQDIRWTIEKMYASEEAVRKDLSQVKEATERLKTYAKAPAQHIKDILETINRDMRLAENVVVFTHMQQDQDSRVSSAQKLNQEALSIIYDFDAALSFFRPFLLSLSKEEQKALLEDASLSDYHLMLKKTFRYSAHTLTADQEYVLSKMGFLNEAPENIYYFLTNADLKFPTLDSKDGAQLTGENFTTIQQDPDVAVRKESFEKLYQTFKSFGNTIATAYYNNVKALTTMAELRHYDSALQMELFEDDVEEAVYDSLLSSIHKNMDLMHRYYAKKKELLGLKEQHMYDVYLPLVKGASKTYTFEEAKELCIASVAPMGEEYQKIYRQAFEEGWVDVYPREGKRGGAYSSGSYDSQPYILMNFTGTLDSVFTLAHEMGHSMHSYFAKQANDYLYHDYTIFAAETASTFNENLLLHYMMQHAQGDREKQELLAHHLDSFKSTVYRQSMFAEFEKIVHERVEAGEALTQADLDQIYLELNQTYFGEAMVSDELIAHEWMRIPHFYGDFYVYKYATGYCASTVLAQRVLQEGEGAVADYFRFLRDGNHHYPIEQLKMAGVDMSKPETVDQALGVFRKLIDQLEEIDHLVD